MERARRAAPSKGERDGGKCDWFKSRSDNKFRVIFNDFTVE